MRNFPPYILQKPPHSLIPLPEKNAAAHFCWLWVEKLEERQKMGHDDGVGKGEFENNGNREFTGTRKSGRRNLVGRMDFLNAHLV